jgi:hypothetical protein
MPKTTPAMVTTSIEIPQVYTSAETPVAINTTVDTPAAEASAEGPQVYTSAETPIAINTNIETPR